MERAAAYGGAPGGHLVQVKSEQFLSEEVNSFNAAFPGLSFHSLLSFDQNLSFMPSAFDDSGFYFQSNANFFAECSSSPGVLKLPRKELQSDVYLESSADSTQSVSFVRKSGDFVPPSPFLNLPDLRSLEQANVAENQYSPQKKARVDSVVSQSQTLESIVQSCVGLQNYAVPCSFKPSPDVSALSVSPPAVPIPRSELARERRQKLSEKTRCLQKLLPWDKKMDTATMLEEAYKYVKFLQAQLKALQSMPRESAMCVAATNQFTACNGGAYPGLGRLNRNQLLQVLVNSPVAQTMLSSNGCCVVSVEQLGSIQMVAQRRAALHEKVSAASCSRGCFCGK